jgi:Histidine kinase-like ATPase domain
MCSYGEISLRDRYVLPFLADPIELHGLRGAVRQQLRDWGALALLDEAQLAVTELVTNVIKHVGSGLSTTLVLELVEDRLRIEVHDISRTAPALKQLSCWEECGRGLHMLAAMATGWGAIASATGKAVWCEFRLGRDGQCLRIHRASTALGAYQGLLSGSGGPGNLSSPTVAEESATHLIADLLHWLAARGGDPDAVLDRAQMNYEAEVA